MDKLSETLINQAKMSSTRCPNNQDENRIRHNIELPPSTLHIFQGDYKSWPYFRDMFTVVYVNGVYISPVVQLKQFTRGEALEIVKKFHLTTNEFQKVWNNLKDSYENKTILVIS